MSVPPDVEAQNELLEKMAKLREEGWVIDRLDEAPTHFPGCDDHTNRFAWYQWTNPEKEFVGYTHMPKDVEF